MKGVAAGDKAEGKEQGREKGVGGLPSTPLGEGQGAAWTELCGGLRCRGMGDLRGGWHRCVSLFRAE